MADEVKTADSAQKKKQIKEDKKKLKEEEKKQKQDIKKRAKEISKRESEIADESESGGGVPAFLVTLIIIVVWLAILCLLVKLDVGHFGSNVLTPLLKDVPVINMILPGETETETTDTTTYGGYSSLKEAVDYLNVVELELEHEQSVNESNQETIAALQAEVDRLSEFEDRMVEFEREYEQFYEEVIYSEKGPGAEEYKKYYESINPTTAAALYKQVVLQLEEDAEVEEWAQAYSEMKPKQAAAIFDVADDLNEVAKILNAMDAETRGDILAQMDQTIAWKLTKLMDPDN